MRANRHNGSPGIGPGQGLWPILLLLLAAVLVPTACVVWFMGQAVRNERIAVRQKLTDAYRSQLESAARQINSYWEQRAADFSASVSSMSGPQAFARLVPTVACDSAVIYDSSGRLIYPAGESPSGAVPERDNEQWAIPRTLEFGASDFSAAADAYSSLAQKATDPGIAARALQAQARCLAKAGQKEAAVKVLAVTLGDPIYRDASDAAGRFIVPNAQLMALELIGDPSDPRYVEVLERLTARLCDYSEHILPPSQKVFLVRQLQQMAPGHPWPATFAAEALAADYLATRPSLPPFSGLLPANLPDLWRISSPDGAVVALFRTERLVRDMQSLLEKNVPLKRARVQALPPGKETLQPGPLVSLPAGRYFPDWQLAIYLEGADPFSAAAHRQIASYFWTGLLVIAFTTIIAGLVGRYLLRQVRLTRLKNDFIATVSHELKTPLASMRALVDTLLEGNYRDQEQVRDYLQLAAKENERLSRLIDNFLTFSRMERDKRAFESVQVTPADVVTAAAEVVQNRFESAGCRFDVDMAPDLPTLTGDRDALVTVLLNLLDNAFKYSENDRQITLRAYAADGNVCFEVQDNGVGLSRRAIRKIFEPFYQVDQRLSRSGGGCGLGLSIVKFIVDAHGGSIEVKSHPGKGSTFTVKLPVTGTAAQV